MTVLYSAEMAGLAAVPVSLPSGGIVDGNVRVKRATIATHTAANVPTLFGVNAAVATIAAEEEIFITIASASLPGSGTLVVDMYFSAT